MFTAVTLDTVPGIPGLVLASAGGLHRADRVGRGLSRPRAADFFEPEPAGGVVDSDDSLQVDPSVHGG
jgi:hypothetical protein